MVAGRRSRVAGWIAGCVVAGACALLAPAAYGGAKPAVVASGSTGVGSAPLIQSGQLTAARSDAELFDFVASGSTVAAIDQNSGSVVVFNEPAGGWSSTGQSAQLDVPTGIAASVAISGPTIVVGDSHATENGLPAEGAAFVYSEPAGGWSGTIEPSAELLPSNGFYPGSFGIAVAVSGPTVMVSGYDPHSIVDRSLTSTEVYAFERPVGGWAGVLHESAQITAAPGAFFGVGAIAMSGRTMFAVNSLSRKAAGIAAFEEPAGGWSSTSRPSAELSVSSGTVFGAISASGRYVMASGVDERLASTPYTYRVFVFKQPRRGWSGDVAPSAALVPESTNLSGSTVASAQHEVAVSMEYQTRAECSGQTFGFLTPSGGWSGTWFERPELSYAACPGGLALSGTTLMANDIPNPSFQLAPAPRITLYRSAGTLQVEAPTIGASISGLNQGRALLKLRVIATPGSPPIRSIRLSLPTGLAFSARRTALLAGLRVFGAKISSITTSPGAMTITLRQPSRSFVITIRPAALRENAALRRRANALNRYNKNPQHRAKRTIVLQSTVTLTDTSHDVMPLSADAIYR